MHPKDRVFYMGGPDEKPDAGVLKRLQGMFANGWSTLTPRQTLRALDTYRAWPRKFAAHLKMFNTSKES